MICINSSYCSQHLYHIGLHLEPHSVSHVMLMFQKDVDPHSMLAILTLVDECLRLLHSRTPRSLQYREVFAFKQSSSFVPTARRLAVDMLSPSPTTRLRWWHKHCRDSTCSSIFQYLLWEQRSCISGQLLVGHATASSRRIHKSLSILSACTMLFGWKDS